MSEHEISADEVIAAVIALKEQLESATVPEAPVLYYGGPNELELYRRAGVPEHLLVETKPIPE